MALFALFSVLTASAVGAYRLTPKPAKVTVDDELLPY